MDMADENPCKIKTNSEETVEKQKTETAYVEDLHEKLHSALKNSDFTQVQRLIGFGVKLCYENKEENCYILAQDKENAEFLTFLLEYDSNGVNAINPNGDSLLMRDIKSFYSRHAELLIDLGADVNYSNENEKYNISILHYATIFPKTPINIIKKLIENKADVNKQIKPNKTIEDITTKYYLPDVYKTVIVLDTPLLCLLRNYRKVNRFEKVKLLIESGANVNVKNTHNETALILAADLKIKYADINLIKYLVKHGAKGGIPSKGKQALFRLAVQTAELKRELSDQAKKDNIVNQYFIPAMDLLIKVGDDLFLRDGPLIHYGYNTSPLSIVLNSFNFDQVFDSKLAMHLLKLAFEKLQNGFVINEKLYQVHPLRSILHSMSSIMQTTELILEISKLIGQYSDITNKFFESTNYHSEYKDFKSCYRPILSGFRYKYVNTKTKITFYTAPLFEFHLSVDSLIKWYQNLIDNNISFCDEDRSHLIYALSLNGLRFGCEDFTKMLNFFTTTFNIPIATSEITFQYDLHKVYQNLFQLPDCIFIPAIQRAVKLLKLVIPYWNQHPLTVLLFIRPWLIERDTFFRRDLITSVEIMIPFLLDWGGPLSHGTQLYHIMEDYISQWKTIKNENADMDELGTAFLYLENAHKSPASLQVLCRTIIRANAIGHGNNLPNYLASLVPSGLQNFLKLTEKYDITLRVC